MAHRPFELLDDLGEVFAEVRTWADVIERKPGVFYVRREPFLHFHLIDGRRRADVKGRDDWTRMDLPHPAPPARRRALLRELRRRHREKRVGAPRDARVPVKTRSR